jgi:two-component sensor histidine kinase
MTQRLQDIARDLAVVIGLVAAATLLRLGMGLVSPAITPFAGYYVAALAATILCGWRYGVLALSLGGAAAWWLFLAPISGNPLLQLAAPVSLLVYGLSAAAVVAVAEAMRRLVTRLRENRGALAERNLEYDNLFDKMSEGFALCEAIWADDGALVDYVVVEINPALQRMLGVGPEVVGRTYADGSAAQGPWLALCGRVMRSGAPERFEYTHADSGRSYEIRISRVTEARMAQFFFDITDRKAAAARQAGLFEELNHRVKNNLALVMGVLQLQARDALPAVREELLKAVGRVHSIAQVHQALYMGARRGDVDFGAYLKDLCASLSLSLVADGRIALEVEAEAIDLPIDTVIPLGMIVNELVTNAVKHAYPPPGTGRVTVDFRRDGDGLRLLVSDEGRGLPDVAADGGGRLGMTLVNSLVGQIKGELAVRHHPGATFEIVLPAGGASSQDARDRRPPRDRSVTN